MFSSLFFFFESYIDYSSFFPPFFFSKTNSPDVEFCAYTIPHPSEPKMNFRIQTYGKTCYIGAKACLDVRLTPPSLDGAAVDALKKGLHDLQDVCDVVAEEFWAKRQAFNSEQGIEQ